MTKAIPKKAGRGGKAAANGKLKSVAKAKRGAASGRDYVVAGKTSDGVTILRGKVPPKNFTSEEIRQTIREVLSALPTKG